MSDVGVVPLTVLEAEVDIVLTSAKAFLMHHAKAEIPMSIFFGRMENEELVVQPFSKSSYLAQLGKELFAKYIEMVARTGAVDAVIMVSEAWGVLPDKQMSIEDWQAWMETHGSLEEHPDRYECLLLSAHTRSHDLYRNVQMFRDESGKVVRFEDIDLHGGVMAREEGDTSYRSRFRPDVWGAPMSDEELEKQTEKHEKEQAEKRERFIDEFLARLRQSGQN